jgi:hypothetical protein
MLYGPANHRLLHGHRPLSEKFAERVAGLLLSGLAAG